MLGIAAVDALRGGAYLAPALSSLVRRELKWIPGFGLQSEGACPLGAPGLDAWTRVLCLPTMAHDRSVLAARGVLDVVASVRLRLVESVVGGAGDPRDYFRFQVPTGATEPVSLTITLTLPSGDPAPLRVHVFDDAGTLCAGRGCEGMGSLVVPPVDPGTTLTVLVEPERPGGVDYRVSVTPVGLVKPTR